MRTILLSIFLFFSGCLTLDDSPEFYVEGLAPDVYFVARSEPDWETYPLGVLVRTAPLKDPVLLPAPDLTINVVTYYGFGDNYYDGSLGLTELTDPLMGNTLWTWQGPVTLPDGMIPGTPGPARFLAVQLTRPLLQGAPERAAARVLLHPSLGGWSRRLQ